MNLPDGESFAKGMEILTQMGREDTMKFHKELSEDL